MRAGDLLDESLAGLVTRPGRTALTILGTVIGLGALVATLGLSRTASNRIVGRFDEVAATEIQLTSRPQALGEIDPALPWNGPSLIRRLEGVAAAGNTTAVDTGDALIRTAPVRDPIRQTEFRLAVQAVSPGLFEAIHADVANGRLFDEGHSARGDRVVVLGRTAAARLGIATVSNQPALAIGDDVFSVIGIVEDVTRQHELLASVMIPEGTAAADYRLASPELLLVETDIGATQLIAQMAPLAVRPDAAHVIKVAAPAEQRRVRDNVESDLELLFLFLGGISLLVGAIGIANVTLVSVMERTGEIGLRRALGAHRRHIAVQFLAESATMGTVGGVIGASLGTLVVVGVAAAQQWTPVLDPELPLLAPLVGAVTGLVAGLYPALRAASMEPVDSLRSGT